MLRHFRPINLLIVVLTLYVVDLHLSSRLIGEETWSQYHVFLKCLIAISTLCITAWGYVDNDIQDIDIDKINKNSVEINIDKLKKYCINLLIINVLFILFFIKYDTIIAVFNVVVMLILWYYNRYGKRQFLIGNILVALLCGLVVLIFWAHYNSQNFNLTSSSIFENYLLFSVLITLLREVIKDAEDIEGDQACGAKTLPIVFGRLLTKIFIFMLILALIFICILFCISIKDPTQISVFQCITFIPIFVLIYFLAKAKHKKDYARMSLLCKIMMGLGLGFLYYLN
jgi:4-hydroxybenzoate polyprenyltransferase